MLARALLTALSTGLFLACVPGGPIYVGPPVATLDGHVYSYEEGVPVPGAEVCVFGADTMCVETNQHGRYSMQLLESQLLEGRPITLRFRIGGLQPAAVRAEDVTVGARTTVNCSISNRLTLGTEPTACLPIPSD